MEVLEVPQLYTTDSLREYRYKLRVELTKVFRRPEKYNAKAAFDTYPLVAAEYHYSLVAEKEATGTEIAQKEVVQEEPAKEKIAKGVIAGETSGVHWPIVEDYLPVCKHLFDRLVYIEVALLAKFSIEHVCFLSSGGIGKFIIAVYGHLLPVSVVKYLALSIEHLYKPRVKGALQIARSEGMQLQQARLGLYLCDSYCSDELVSDLLIYFRDLPEGSTEIKAY